MSRLNHYVKLSFTEGIEDFVQDNPTIDLSKHFHTYDEKNKTFSADLSDFGLGRAPCSIYLHNPKTGNTVQFERIKINKTPDTPYEPGEVTDYEYRSVDTRYSGLKLILFND